MDAEELLCKSGRIRVLKALLENGSMNITRLVKETGLHYRVVLSHIEYLKQLGLVEERRYGKLRIVEVNFGDPRVVALREILRSLEAL